MPKGRSTKWFRKRVGKLQERRDHLRELENTLQEQDQAHLKATETLRNRVIRCDTRTKKYEENIREAMEDEYAKRNNRAPGPGLEVRVRETTTIEDAEAVLQWCRDHNLFLRVNEVEVRSFGKSLEIKGCKTEEKPMTVLSRNFHRFLQEDVDNV